MSIDLNDPAVKEAIKAAVEEATTPLVAKRDELLRELREAKKGRQINPEDVSKLEDEIEALKGQNADLQKAAKKHAGEIETARKQYEAEAAFTTSMLKDAGLTTALMEAGVKNPAHLKAVKAMLANEVQIAVEGDQRVAKIGDKSLKDYVSDWAKSDDGKHFVAAPVNSGGGAPGGSGGGAHKAGSLDGDKAARQAYFAEKYGVPLK